MVCFKHIFTCIFIAALFTTGCRRSVNLPEMIDAHYVKYEIDYLQDRAGNVPTRILPEMMDVYYTNYYVMSRIEGFLDQFTLIQIADLRKKKVATLFSFFGDKVYCEGKNGELPAAIVEPEKVECKFTGETTVIGGLNSERVEVDTGGEQFNIYITKDFNTRLPNIGTPYKGIDYPLSEFRIQMSSLKMSLSCTEFEKRSVESDIFTIPEDYSEVSREEMEVIINSLFTTD